MAFKNWQQETTKGTLKHYVKPKLKQNVYPSKKRMISTISSNQILYEGKDREAVVRRRSIKVLFLKRQKPGEKHLHQSLFWMNLWTYFMQKKNFL